MYIEYLYRNMNVTEDHRGIPRLGETPSAAGIYTYIHIYVSTYLSRSLHIYIYKEKETYIIYIPMTTAACLH